MAPVFRPLDAPARYKGTHGGRGSAKSHEFARRLVRAMVNGPTRAVCVREVQKSLAQSVKRLLEDKIKKFGLEEMFRITEPAIHGPHGGIIVFQGMQDHTATSIKSLEGFDIAWVEEAQAFSAKSLQMLRPTIRKPGSEMWFSWNPSQPTDPIDDLFRGPGGPPPGATCVAASFRDNPWFPEDLRKDMAWDRKRDEDKYQHVWEGGYEKHSEARIFKHWRVEEFMAPRDAVWRLGGDWGFSVDPAVMLRGFEGPRHEGRRQEFFIDGEAYKIGCEIDALPALFDQADAFDREDPLAPSAMRAWKVTADSSRPDTISYMRRHGWPRMERSRKGAGSIKDGVAFLQGYDFVVHPRCVHTIDEFTEYKHPVDKLTGLVLPILPDKKNHVIDALRYSAEDLMDAAKGVAGTW